MKTNATPSGWRVGAACVVGLGVAVVVAQGCTGGSHGPPQPMAVSRTIGASGGTITSADGQLTLDVPAGALASDTVISVAVTTAAPPGQLGSAYDLAPDGTSFSRPAQISIHYQPADFGTVQIATASGGAWVPQPTVAGSASTLLVLTSHLSTWALIPTTYGVPYVHSEEYCCMIAGGCFDTSSCVFYRPCCRFGCFNENCPIPGCDTACFGCGCEGCPTGDTDVAQFNASLANCLDAGDTKDAGHDAGQDAAPVGDGGVACGEPGLPCCPYNSCTGGGCCSNDHCLASGGVCYPASNDVCTGGACSDCGGPGAPCCPISVDGPYSCTAPFTVCGGSTEGSTCVACGASGGSCCPGGICQSGMACNGSGQCP